MNIELHKFKKISEDKKSATLQHPLGHKITIAKNVLSPDLKKQVESLSLHLADGGEVTDDLLSQEEKVLDAKSEGLSEERNLSAQGKVQDFPEAKTFQMAEEEVPDQSGPPKSTQEDVYNQVVQQNLDHLKSVNVPYKLGIKSEDDLKKRAEEEALNSLYSQKQEESANAVAQQKSNQARVEEHYNHDVAYIKDQNTKRQALGLSPLPLPVPPAMNNAVADAGPSQPESMNEPELPKQQQEEAPQPQQQPKQEESFLPPDVQETLKKNAASQAATAEVGNNLIKNISSHIENLQHDINAGHINPHQLFDNMSMGQKVLNFVGLILGGLGGAAGQENLPAKMIDQQIQRDIESQKLNMDKKMNLLGSNMKLLNDLPSAINMTYANQSRFVADKLKAAAAQTQDPQKQFHLLNMASVFEGNAAQATQQIATKMMMMDQLKQGGASQQTGSTDAIAQKIDAMRIMNPELAKSMESRFIPGVGLGQKPIPDATSKEIISRQTLDTQIRKLENFAKQNQGSLDPQKIAEGAAIAKLVQDAYRSAAGQGVFREAEKNFVESIIDQDPTKFLAGYRTLPKYKAFREDNLTRLSDLKRGYGLPDVMPAQRPRLGPPV